MRGPGRPASKRGKTHRSVRLRADAAAVTPLVGTVLILAIAVAGLGVVMTWGLPALKQTQADAELAGVLHQFENLEELAENVIRSGGVGKANEATLSFTDGQVERVDGTLFVLAMHPYDTTIDERYWLEVQRQPDRYQLKVFAAPGVNTNNRWAESTIVTSTAETEEDSASSWTNGEISLADVLLENLDGGSLRVRVATEVDDEVVTIMEAWVLSAGALDYHRQAPFGEVSMHLEFGSVVTTYESGSHIHTAPLARLETAADGNGGTNPAFLGFFAQLLVPDPEEPGLESAGPGGHPIRLSLQENVLRIGGARVADVSIQAMGPRGALWEELYRERYGFIDAVDSTRYDPALTPGVVLEMGERLDPVSGLLVPDPFQFVLMESRIEISLLPGAVRLDA